MACQHTWRLELSCLQTAMRHQNVLKVEYDWSDRRVPRRDRAMPKSNHEAQHLDLVYRKLDHLIRCM